ncbi:hypothetical protein DIU31_024455 [Mucilaginibacter rubeus]|nr:hypothetical protein [Mucilaginibacter rubeus]QEM06512.1 hypothetical protein DIU31_024455 [Mucilaginibacter rubeus]QEM19101.1 hypothetical protein DIU38_024720 [Mucilaginibacter gossypii]QTE56041.1 hypothetical protein J3L23_28210 [Mucilaginibacter rubeus]QTF63254.1 hypothetical protein J3L20_05290 [Mucilaginibacter rubeus]
MYKSRGRQVSATAIFCPGLQVDVYALQEELKDYYQAYYQTEKTIVIGGNYMENLASDIFANKEAIFRYVPQIEEASFYDNLHILAFDGRGKLSELQHEDAKPYPDLSVFSKQYIHKGLQEIFVKNEGLVTAAGKHHHFVFPSGKHSDRFLRVANVLIYSSEILFVAHSLLPFFDPDLYKTIYCDTSSINSVALALNDLINRFRDGQDQKVYPIVSFRSYEGLYNNKSLTLKANNFIIISASTSGGMLDYFLRTHGEIKKDNLVILYFLENRKPSEATLEQVVCNLTHSDANPNGIEKFHTPDAEQCSLCKENSFAVEVAGDVFLLEKPKVNSIRIRAEDMDLSTIGPFVNQFMSVQGQSSFLKVNYKETGDESSKKYEIYIDYGHVIDCITEERLKNYKTRLDAYIHQFVPSNLKYILYLNDTSSKKLAGYIYNAVIANYASDKQPEMISQNEFKTVKKSANGSIVIVGSCISNGKNLLYLSRALRNYDLRIIYFIGINRSPTPETYSFLKTNLKYGRYGSENSSFVEVEKIHCSNLSLENAWQTEVEFLKAKIAEVDDEDILKFLRLRLKTIENGYSDDIRGIHNDIFLPRVFPRKSTEPLKIRRNSAFFSKPDYAKNVSQSDVYFTIAYVINRLRYINGGHTLKQSMFVRNVIAPENLNRFNDGIIQASILRGAKKNELNYAISDELSAQVREIIVTIFKYYEQEQGEAILEFLFALAIKKLFLKKRDLLLLLQELETIPNKIIQFYTQLIKTNLTSQVT